MGTRERTRRRRGEKKRRQKIRSLFKALVGN